MESRLFTALEMVNEWLQFAEAKNVGMVALTALGITGVLTYLATVEATSQIMSAGLLLTALLLVLSLSTSLLSFLPRTDPVKLARTAHGTPRETDNLYFYGDLRKYKPEQLASAVASVYEGLQDYDPARHRSHVDLASQIVNNSRIVVAKNAYFRRATWLALSALASAAVFTALSLVLER